MNKHIKNTDLSRNTIEYYNYHKNVVITNHFAPPST